MVSTYWMDAPESAVAGLDQDVWYRRIVYLYVLTP